MENTPARIAADILNTAMTSGKISFEEYTAEEVASLFTTIHAAVHEAAKKDYEASLSNPHIK